MSMESAHHVSRDRQTSLSATASRACHVFTMQRISSVALRPTVYFTFAGTTKYGGERRGSAAIADWFATIFADFPDIRIDPIAIVV